MAKISFSADKVGIRGPKADNSYQVIFEVGEYETGNIKDLLGVTDQILKVEVELQKWQKIQKD